MKIRMTVTLDVDQEVWAREYGIDMADVRQDVIGYVIGWIEQTPIPLKVTLWDKSTTRGEAHD